MDEFCWSNFYIDHPKSTDLSYNTDQCQIHYLYSIQISAQNPVPLFACTDIRNGCTRNQPTSAPELYQSTEPTRAWTSQKCD